MHNLFENNPDIEGASSILLSEMLIACASVEVLFGDGLPYNLCDSCKDKLLNAYKFRLQCQKSNSTLRVLSNAESKDNITKEENILVQPDDICEGEDERPLSERVLVQGIPKKNNSGFSCNFCHKVLRTKRGLQGHLRVHAGEKTSQCTDPLTLHSNSRDQRSLTSESIENYIKQEKEEVEVKLEVMSIEEDSVDKETCEEYIDNLISDNFTNNLRLNEDDKTVNTQDVSGQGTTKRGEQNSHVSTNGAISDRLLSEDDQDITGGLPVAKKRVYKKNKVCHVCGASFSRLNLLTKHMKSHRSLLMHQCDKCKKAFATEEYLKKHLKEEHVNKPYVCTACNKSFTKGAYLINHLKVHQKGAEEGGVSLSCSMCDTTFTSWEQLVSHIKVHVMEDKQHTCGECGKVFNRLENLKVHRNIHTGAVRNTRLRLCIYCGKEFSNMTRHNRVHTGERPYACSLCGKSFTQWNDLNHHKMRHSGARPFGCNDCPACFVQSTLLKRHCKKTGHSMEERPHGFQDPHRVEPAVSVHEPRPVTLKVQGKSVEINQAPGDSPMAERIVEETEERSVEGSSQAS
ncbi:hypothetical protein NQ318_020072 [Aromia moschata]|uniref:Uncharacterized protein n=1 Tax=Aromia moschata TaxID=1265417 RepID=A0AAV8ZA21_9CUCU|nr:hypothetical protein NQ318_020072 [Aromia moschata]